MTFKRLAAVLALVLAPSGIASARRNDTMQVNQQPIQAPDQQQLPLQHPGERYPIVQYDVAGGAPQGGYHVDESREGRRVIRLSQDDISFLENATRANRSEVLLSKLALKRAQSIEVRDLAIRMKKDHDAQLRQLHAIAIRDGLDLPSDVTPMQRATYRRLASLTGRDFDLAFLDEMSRAHQDAIALYQSEAHGGANPDLRQLADSSLPTLRMHMNMAQSGRSRFY